MNTNNLGKNTDTSDNIEQPVGEKHYEISDIIKQAVSESQILVSYISRYSPVKVDRDATKILIESNYMIKENRWGSEQEVKFWNAYDQVASTIEPVTIESLKATMYSSFEEKTGKKNLFNAQQTDAARSVMRYGFITACALIFLLMAQIYWINGSDLTSKVGKLFKQIDVLSFNIEQKKLDKKAWFKTGLHFLDSLHFSETDLTDKYQKVIYSTHP
jgi:hypothetical protein